MTDTHDEVFRQIVRLKRQWGYGRWSREQAEAIAEEAAQRADEIQLRHPPRFTAPAPEPAIPPILHRVVPERTSAATEAMWDRARALHPGWGHVTHRDPLDPGAFPLLGDLWGEARHGAQLADMIRAEVLWRYGGVYIDSDVELVRPLDPLLELGCFAAWEDERAAPNAVMGCAPGHPAMRALIEYMRERIPGPVWWAGPGAVTAMFRREDVTLLDPLSFYPVHYREPEREAMVASVLADPPPETFGVHLYEGSWLRR